MAWTSHGQTHQVTGVRVDKVLLHSGFTPGQMGKDVPVKEKVKGYREVLVATARDGFQAVFSCAEVMEGMGTTAAFIVWQVDGKPLGPEAGPLRIVVPRTGSRRGPFGSWTLSACSTSPDVQGPGRGARYCGGWPSARKR